MPFTAVYVTVLYETRYISYGFADIIRTVKSATGAAAIFSVQSGVAHYYINSCLEIERIEINKYNIDCTDKRDNITRIMTYEFRYHSVADKRNTVATFSFTQS